MNATAQASIASFTGPKLDNRRVLAALVDLGIVLAGALVILVAADSLSGDRGGALGAVILGWALYYYFALESGGGQTVGKKLMKLRVVRADGRPAEMREIAVRTVLRVVDGIGAYIVGLIVMLATGQRRQRLGDLAAGTIVVDASATPYAPPAPAPAAVPVEETEADSEPVEDESVDAQSTITLPSRPAPPATLADLAAPEAPEAPAAPEMRPFPPVEPADEADPVEDEPVEDEPVAAVEVVQPVEDEPVAVVQVVEPVEDEPAPIAPAPVAPVALVEVDEPVEEEPVALTVVEDVEDDVVEDEPVAPLAVVEVEEPVEDEPADQPLPDLSTPSLEQLASDVAAARTEPVPVAEPALEDEPAEDEPADEPITLRSVETVSAIDLVMGGADEDDSSDEDQAPEGPAAS